MAQETTRSKIVRASEIKVGDHILEDDDGPLGGGSFVVFEIEPGQSESDYTHFYGRGKGSKWTHYTNAESFLPIQKIIIEEE